LFLVDFYFCCYSSLRSDNSRKLEQNNKNFLLIHILFINNSRFWLVSQLLIAWIISLIINWEIMHTYRRKTILFSFSKWKRPVSTGTWLSVAIFLKIDSTGWRLKIKEIVHTGICLVLLHFSYSHTAHQSYLNYACLCLHIYSYLNSVVDFSEHHSRLKKMIRRNEICVYGECVSSTHL